MSKRFVEYEGSVHLISPIMGGEFTICGDAFDAASSENMPELEQLPTTETVVTCPKCTLVIKECRNVMTSVKTK